MTRTILPTMQCNPILVIENAKTKNPELYQQLADEYYKTEIGGSEFISKYSGTENSVLAWAIVQLR